MYYVLLIYADESGMGSMAPGEIESITKAVDQFDEELTKAGQNIGNLRLQPSMTGTTVRVRDGKTLTTDGPFIESKGQLVESTWSKPRTWTRLSVLHRDCQRPLFAPSKCGLFKGSIFAAPCKPGECRRRDRGSWPVRAPAGSGGIC